VSVSKDAVSVENVIRWVLACSVSFEERLKKTPANMPTITMTQASLWTSFACRRANTTPNSAMHVAMKPLRDAVRTTEKSAITT